MVPLQGSYPSPFILPPRLPSSNLIRLIATAAPFQRAAEPFTSQPSSFASDTFLKKKMIFIFWEFQSWRWAEWKRGACFVQRGRSPPRLIRKEGDCVPHLMKWECYLSGGVGRGVGGLYVRYQWDVFGISRPLLLKKNLSIECSYVEIALMSCFLSLSFTFYLLFLEHQRRSSSVLELLQPVLSIAH